MTTAMMLVCLAGSAVFGQGDQTIFEAPRIEVKNSSHGDKAYSYLLYNRLYLGRQYHRNNVETDLPQLPTTYFHDKSPIGVIMADRKWFPDKGALPVAVLGMDVGTLAAYAKPGQVFHFTERVPIFVKLSLPDKGERRYFTFVQDAIKRGAKIKIFEGEPREMLEKHGADKFYKVIVVESYKMPDIEVHKELMTKEALNLLMGKIREDGIVAFHTSNRYYDLPPIIASAAKELKFACTVGIDRGYYDDPNKEKNEFRFSSEWVMVARDSKYLTHLKNDESNRIDWHPLTPIDNDQFLWTDKGEQSFRGLYLSDPQIDRLHDALNDMSDFLINKVGLSPIATHKIGESIRGVIRAWSQASAEAPNRPRKSGSKDGVK